MAKGNQLFSAEQICLQVSQLRGSFSEKASALTNDGLEPTLCLCHLLPFWGEDSNSALVLSLNEQGFPTPLTLTACWSSDLDSVRCTALGHNAGQWTFDFGGIKVLNGGDLRVRFPLDAYLSTCGKKRQISLCLSFACSSTVQLDTVPPGTEGAGRHTSINFGVGGVLFFKSPAADRVAVQKRRCRERGKAAAEVGEGPPRGGGGPGRLQGCGLRGGGDAVGRQRP